MRLLARHFAEQYATRTGTPVPIIDHSALERLVSHSWPGNVRELKNAIERAALLSGGNTILPEHLPPEVAGVDTLRRNNAAALSVDDGAPAVSIYHDDLFEQDRFQVRVILAAGGTTGKLDLAPEEAGTQASVPGEAVLLRYVVGASIIALITNDVVYHWGFVGNHVGTNADDIRLLYG